VKVRVLEVDVARKRISLSMRRDANAAAPKPAPRDGKRSPGPSDRRATERPAPQGAFGAALAEALRKR